MIPLAVSRPVLLELPLSPRLAVRCFLWSLCFACSLASAYSESPKRPVELQGRWVLNSAQSDDAEQMLMERLQKQREADRKRLERWLGKREPSGSRAIPPVGEEGVEVPAATRAARERMMRRRAREEDLFKRMLNVTKTLNIRQDGRRIEIDSAVESRRFDAGTESQVSMPEGQIADLETGWDGEWFVVHRRSRSGPRAIEKFRVLKKTGQLEYYMAWSGETELSGMRIRRIFDRTQSAPSVANPDVGPIR